MDRRAVFFLISAVIAGALSLVAEAEHRWVAQLVCVTYAVLSAASALDSWSRSRS